MRLQIKEIKSEKIDEYSGETKMKAQKINFATRIVSGGLSDGNQEYSVNYLEPETGYTDKAELAIQFIKKIGNEEKRMAYRSLRFNSTEQMKLLIEDLSVAYIYFTERRLGDIPITAEIRMDLLQDLINCISKKVRAGWSKNGRI